MLVREYPHQSWGKWTHASPPTFRKDSVQFELGYYFISHLMSCRYLYPTDLNLQLSPNQKAPKCYKQCFKSKAVCQLKWLQPSICAFENSFPIKPFFSQRSKTSAHILFLCKQAKFVQIITAECKMWLTPQKLCILSTLPFLYVKLFQICIFTLWKNEESWDFFITTNERSDDSVMYLLTVYKGWSFLRDFFPLSSEHTEKLRWCKYKYRHAGQEISEEQ